MLSSVLIPPRNANCFIGVFVRPLVSSFLHVLTKFDRASASVVFADESSALVVRPFNADAGAAWDLMLGKSKNTTRTQKGLKEEQGSTKKGKRHNTEGEKKRLLHRCGSAIMDTVPETSA